MYNRRFPFHHTPASGKRLDFIRIMIAIIAEKPSVGQDIARVVGATEKKDGYIVGNGYMVTWDIWCHWPYRMHTATREPPPKTFR